MCQTASFVPNAKTSRWPSWFEPTLGVLRKATPGGLPRLCHPNQLAPVSCQLCQSALAPTANTSRRVSALRPTVGTARLVPPGEPSVCQSLQPVGEPVSCQMCHTASSLPAAKGSSPSTMLRSTAMPCVSDALGGVPRSAQELQPVAVELS